MIKHRIQYVYLAQLVKTVDLHPNKNYILGYHPHGIMSTGAFATFGTDTCRFTEVFPGVKPTLAVLAGLFMIPIFREYLMSGGTSISAESKTFYYKL